MTEAPNITDIDPVTVEHIALHMREADRREVMGTRPYDNQAMFGREAYTVLRNFGRGRVVWHRGQPVAVIGFWEQWPGVWSAVLFATDDWQHVAAAAVAWFRTTGRELREELGAHRVEVASHIQHWQAHRFLRALGAKPESTLRQYGKDGSAYIRFVWLTTDYQQFQRSAHVLQCSKDQRSGHASPSEAGSPAN
jgi:RimJ/RimL family protein N-acetyltransferase